MNTEAYENIQEREVAPFRGGWMSENTKHQSLLMKRQTLQRKKVKLIQKDYPV